MSRVLKIGVIALMMAAAVSATQLCAVGTLDQYIALGSAGCTIDDKTFSNFTYVDNVSGGATAIAAGSVSVTPDTTPFDPGVLFNGAWQANAGQTNDAFITFLVTVNGQNLVEDASLVQLGSNVNPIGGDGTATIGETLCVGGTKFPCVGTVTKLTTFDNGTTFKLQANTVFTPNGTVFASKDLQLNGGETGFAAVSGIQDNFSEVVPEPASIILLGSALLGLGFLRRRRLS